jgi:ABC-type transporter Mla subunit MlaD
VATEARRFQVGVFVIAAVAIALAAAIWLGASRYLADESRTVTYFSESVQGLDPGAAVKYRGVPAGRVERIGIAPDGDLIEVVMSVDTKFADRMLNDLNLRAQLQLSGITGLRYVEIDRHVGDALERSPKLSFTPPYQLIPSTPSQFKAVQEALEDIYGRVMSIDFAGISADTRATLQGLDQLLRDDRVQQILSHLSDITGSARTVMANVDQMTAGVRLAPVVADLQKTNAEAKSLLVDFRDGVTGQQLRGALREVDGLARTSQSFVLDLQVMVDRLNRTTENLEQLTELLRQQPSQLLFSAPPPARPAERPR